MNAGERLALEATAAPEVRWTVYTEGGQEWAACYLDGRLLRRSPGGEWHTLNGRNGTTTRQTVQARVVARAKLRTQRTRCPRGRRWRRCSGLLVVNIEIRVVSGRRLAPPPCTDWRVEVVATLDPHTEADPVAVLVSFLVGFGSAFNSGPHARADGADHSARLNIVIAGATAKARKGTSWRNPRNVLAIADERWAATRVLGGLSSGEGLIAAVADPMPDKEGNLVGGVADKRLLVVEEEFGRVLAVAGRDANILSHVVRQAWDNGHLRTMTKTPLVATGAHVSVLGHVTLEELRLRLTESDISSGFANRFLFVLARRSKRLPGGGNLDDADLAYLGRKVRDRLLVARNLGRMRRSAEAEERWAELYNNLADDEPGGQLGNVTARGDAQVLRLSLTYAAIDGSKTIELEHLEAAWALWRYCRASAEVIFGDALADTVATWPSSATGCPQPPACCLERASRPRCSHDPPPAPSARDARLRRPGGTGVRGPQRTHLAARRRGGASKCCVAPERHPAPPPRYSSPFGPASVRLRSRSTGTRPKVSTSN